MDRRRKLIIITLVFLLILILVFGRLGQPTRKGGKPASPGTETPRAKIESRLPYPPTTVNFEKVTSPVSLPEVLPVYKVSGQAAQAFGEGRANLFARALLFSGSPEVRVSSGGGRSYIFRDQGGGVLTVFSSPPQLNYSEIPSLEGEPPSLARAVEQTLDFVQKVGLDLPQGWQIKVVTQTYLAGSGTTAQEVDTAAGADAVRVTLSFFYRGRKVLNSRGESEFLEFVWGRSGSLISARVRFLVNNPALMVESLGDIPVKNFTEVQNSFATGEAQAISLNLWGSVSDEAILTPPAAVLVESLEPVLVIDQENLFPYYLVSSRGTLNSGRAGKVVYLVAAGK